MGDAALVALEQIDRWPAAQVAAGVVRASGVVASHGPLRATFAWASVTKLLTAAAVLVAAEEGIIGLDEPAGPADSTVRHLLAHASGLPPERGAPIARPGERRIYSNAGYELLAELVAERSGMPFRRYLRDGILEPAGMTATHLPASAAWSAHGPLDDLLLFARQLLRPTVIAPETLAEATAVAFPGLGGVLPGYGRQEPNDWGLGFEIRDGKAPHWTGTSNSPRAFGHFGRSGTFLWVDPDAGLALACLSDLEFGDWAREAWPALSDAVLAE